MSLLQEISFENQSRIIKEKVENYWANRADGFFTLKREEVSSFHGEVWKQELLRLLPDSKDLKILDVGCGAGFFEAILGRMGHRVTGIDLTEEMVMKADKMIAFFGLDKERVTAQVMDAEQLDFPDESFDAVISRNLTWTLPHPQAAYREWYRVLKKGGVLVNFDAEYARNAHTNLYSENNLAHRELSKEMKDECHEIYHMLSISTCRRPEWDKAILKETGFFDITADLDFGDRVYGVNDKFYIPDRMFAVRACRR